MRERIDDIFYGSGRRFRGVTMRKEYDFSKMKRVKPPFERPVKCLLCGKQMHYSGHPKHELEYVITISTDNYGGCLWKEYVHRKCFDGTKMHKRIMKSEKETNNLLKTKTPVYPDDPKGRT